MSTELVPQSYGREAYNALHGTELKTHTDALTPEQAARINNTYDIEVFVGTHGIVDENPDKRLWPTQKEYAAAAAVVSDMQPGDTLYTERYGHNRSPAHLPVGAFETLLDSDDLVKRAMGQMMLSHIQTIKDEVQEDRTNYRVTAWQYAEKVAQLKGVRVVHADQDAFDSESFQALTGGRALRDVVMRPTGEEERALADRVDIRRAKAARNIIKDDALEHLPPEGTPPPQARKPKLRLLFGEGHTDDLQQVFDELGLKVKITVLESSTLAERAAEHGVPVEKLQTPALHDVTFNRRREQFRTRKQQLTGHGNATRRLGKGAATSTSRRDAVMVQAAHYRQSETQQ